MALSCAGNKLFYPDFALTRLIAQHTMLPDDVFSVHLFNLVILLSQMGNMTCS